MLLSQIYFAALSASSFLKVKRLSTNTELKFLCVWLWPWSLLGDVVPCPGPEHSWLLFAGPSDLCSPLFIASQCFPTKRKDDNWSRHSQLQHHLHLINWIRVLSSTKSWLEEDISFVWDSWTVLYKEDIKSRFIGSIEPKSFLKKQQPRIKTDSRAAMQDEMDLQDISTRWSWTLPTGSSQQDLHAFAGSCIRVGAPHPWLN